MTQPGNKTSASTKAAETKAADAKAVKDERDEKDTRATREEQTDFARLGVNPDVSDFVEYGGYREEDSEDWKPNPHFQYGTLDTSDTAGGAHQNIKEVSPVFEVGRAQALNLAARALNPEDTEVSESVVSLPEDTLTNEEARRNLLDKVEALKNDKVVVGGPTAEQRLAAKDADGNVAEPPNDGETASKKTSEDKK